MPWPRLLAAMLVVLGVPVIAAPSARAGGVSMLPFKAGDFKTILLRSVSAGEWIVNADFTITNHDRTDLIWCALWGNPTESQGTTGWQRLDYDQIQIGSSSNQLDGDIHLVAVVDSLRRFQVKVQCGHNRSGFRPMVEPGASLGVRRNLNI